MEILIARMIRDTALVGEVGFDKGGALARDPLTIHTVVTGFAVDIELVELRSATGGETFHKLTATRLEAGKAGLFPRIWARTLERRLEGVVVGRLDIAGAAILLETGDRVRRGVADAARGEDGAVARCEDDVLIRATAAGREKESGLRNNGNIRGEALELPLEIVGALVFTVSELPPGDIDGCVAPVTDLDVLLIWLVGVGSVAT